MRHNKGEGDAEEDLRNEASCLPPKGGHVPIGRLRKSKCKKKDWVALKLHSSNTVSFESRLSCLCSFTEDPLKMDGGAPALGSKKTVEELLEMDAEDESLAKYKRSLMGTGDKGDPDDPRLLVLLVRFLNSGVVYCVELVAVYY